MINLKNYLDTLNNDDKVIIIRKNDSNSPEQVTYYTTFSEVKDSVLSSLIQGTNMSFDTSVPGQLTISLDSDVSIDSLTVSGPITENTQELTVTSGSATLDVYEGGICTLLLEKNVILNADAVPDNTTVKILVTQDGTGNHTLDILNLFSPNGALDISATADGVSIVTMTKINGLWYGYAIKLYELVLDVDAAAFLTAASITDGVISKAINNLTLSLKAANLWGKMVALYPFVGGTASTHKFNLLDPVDADASFRMTFSGTWTHNANGITGNGVDTTADTKIIPVTDLTDNSTHISLYSGTANTSSVPDIQCGPDGTSLISLFTKHPTFGFLSDMYDYNVNRIQTPNTASTGFYAASRVGASDFRAFKDGVQIGSTNTTTSQGFSDLATETITVGNLTTARTYSLVSVGTGLTLADVQALNAAVVTFQTELSRNV